MRDDALAGGPEAVADSRRAQVQVEPPATEPEERVVELTRALAAGRERESAFRQAAFELNAELLRKEAEIQGLRERIDVADAQVSELRVTLSELRARLSELEDLTQTRAFHAATSWWRMKAAIRRR